MAAEDRRRISCEERNAQLLELARTKVSEIDPDKLRLRKFIRVIPRGAVESINPVLLRKIRRMAFLAYTRAEVLLTYGDWLATMTRSGRLRPYPEGPHQFLTVQQYVDNHFTPGIMNPHFVEIPLEFEEVRSPCSAIGPKRAVAE